MNIRKAWENNRSRNIRAFSISVVLLLFVLLPIFSNAASVADIVVNDAYHGHLDIKYPKSISMSFKSGSIKADDIIKAANLSATLKRTMSGKEQTFDADPSFSISDDDLHALNSATKANHPVTIAVEGQYTYHCTGCNKDKTVIAKVEINVIFTAPTYNVTFDANGGAVNGGKTHSVKLESDSKNGMAAGSIIPGNVKRDGYDFMGWSVFKEKLNAFTADSIVKDDMIVYALWSKSNGSNHSKKNLPGIPGTTNPTDPTDPMDSKVHTPTMTRCNMVLGDVKVPLSSGDNSTNSNTVNNSVKKPDLYTKAEFASLVQSQNIPVAKIGNGSVPLFTPDGVEGWSFINLLLGIMGVVMVLACLVISIKFKKNLKSMLFIISAAAGLIGLELFFVTENFRLSMVMVDGWTIVNAILFVVTIVAMILFLKEDEEPEESWEYAY